MPVISKRKRTRSDNAPEQPPLPDEPKKPRRSGVSLSVWIPKKLREAVDAYIASQRPPPDITGVVIAALEDFLQPKGFWPHSPEQKAGNAE